MPNIIKMPPKQPTYSQRLNMGIGQALQGLTEAQSRSKENEALERLTGQDVSGLPEQYKRMAYESALKRQEQENKTYLERLQDPYVYDTIKDQFGEKSANLYMALTRGGQTELAKQLLDSLSRGQTFGEKIEETKGAREAEQEGATPKKVKSKELPQLTREATELPEGHDYPDFTRPPTGYTQKDWNKQRSEWQKFNLPIYKENADQLAGTQRDLLGTQNLIRLNQTGKVAEGFIRTLINPETGEFYGLAQLAGMQSPESQEWVKEIARFQNRAKNAFGARVTNFDLQQYMKQFPSLMNTPEGRARILDMVRINFELDELYENALNLVFQKYGTDGISYDQADMLSRKMIKKETEKLEREYLRLDAENKDEVYKEKAPTVEQGGTRRKLADILK